MIQLYQIKMNTKQNSLMERRKKNLVQLKNTIQTISLQCRQKSHLQSSDFFKRHVKSTNNVQDVLEQKIQAKSFLDSIPLLNGQTTLQKKISQEPVDSSKNFYEIFFTEQILGEGTNGVVKKCSHKISLQEYAVKILQMQDEHFHYLKTNFINIKQLKHESIIQYKALFMNCQQRKCHIVMEYFPYPYLKKGLKQQQIKIVFYKLLDALEYIHKNNICHRDIKPENILYDRKNQILKIIDFGVSKNMKIRGRYQEMLTKTGTLYYKAPEMFDAGGYTEKVDCWAVGITLYEMIVGETPFASQYLGQTIDNILHKELDMQRDEFKNYEPFLKDLILRLLKKNPKDRVSCEEAKKHLWFNTNLRNIDVLQSANYQFQTCNNLKNYKADPNTGFLVKKKSSLIQVEGQKQCNKVSKTDKKIIKKYFQLLTYPNHIIQDKVSIDFLDSDGQQKQGELKKGQKVIAQTSLDCQFQKLQFKMPQNFKFDNLINATPFDRTF